MQASRKAQRVAARRARGAELSNLRRTIAQLSKDLSAAIFDRDSARREGVNVRKTLGELQSLIATLHKTISDLRSRVEKLLKAKEGLKARNEYLYSYGVGMCQSAQVCLRLCYLPLRAGF